MDLPIEIITMDSLMKRWNMSFMDIVLVVANHELSPVYKEYLDPNLKKVSDLNQDILAPFYDPKADTSKIVFMKSDIEQIETKFDGHVSKSSEVIHEDDLIKRLGISQIELWNLQEARSIDIFDSLGVQIDDIETFKTVPALIPGGGYVGYYFGLSDVEKLEKEYGGESLQSTYKKEPKLRPSQKHRINCRKIAEQLWKEDPDLTIADMAVVDQITEACDGVVYAEKTIRNWIKDLCPNRSPGRRPKVK